MASRAKLTGKGRSGRHYQVPRNLTDSAAYRSLSLIAFKLWHDLMLQFNGRNNGEICAILSQLRQYGWSNGSLYKALPELIEKGLIVRNYQGGLGPAGKQPSRYRFTHLPAEVPQFDCPRTGPTNEFLNWKPSEK